MAMAQPANVENATELRTDHVPHLSDEERRRRNLAAVALLDSWENEGDEQDQRETMQVLQRALGQQRSGSARPLFP